MIQATFGQIMRAQGLSTDKIVDKYSELEHRYEAMRLIRKALKVLLESIKYHP